MSTTTQASHLSELPVEVLERIFLFLAGQDIIRIEVVRTTLQMNAALVFIPWPSCDIGFSTLPGYPSAFSHSSISTKYLFCRPVRQSERCLRSFSASEGIRRIRAQVVRRRENSEELSQAPSRHNGRSPDHGYWPGSRDLSFIRVPPATSQKPLEWWSFPPLPFQTYTFVPYLPDGLLVVVEEKER